MDRVKEAIKEWFGPRCPDFAEHCAACQAWAEFDQLRIAGLKEALHMCGYCPDSDGVREAIRARISELENP